MPSPPDAPARVEAFIADVLPPAPRRVLDLGCGTGVLLPPLLARLPGHASVIEMDFAHAMLLRGSSKFVDARIGYVCADAGAPPFPAGTFDAVLCFNVLPHLGEYEEALARLWCLVRAGGRLAVGHLRSSAELNAFHSTLSDAVNRDRLPSTEQAARCLALLGATICRADEAPGRYFVLAEKH